MAVKKKKKKKYSNKKKKKVNNNKLNSIKNKEVIDNLDNVDKYDTTLINIGEIDEIVEDEIDELEKTVILEPIVDKRQNFGINKRYKGLKKIILSVSFVAFCLMMILFPRIDLLGESKVVISYNDSYQEPGYSAYILNEDVTENILVDGNVLDGVVGDYKLTYYINKYGIKFKKVRKVSVVDKEAPEINVFSDVIHVCPNESVPDFEYSAIDEYDGDVTNKINKIVNDNEVILSVSDASDNTSSKVIMVDRTDEVAPVIKLKGDSIMYLSYGSKYNEPGYTVNDNCTDNLNDKVEVDGSVLSEIGTYIITYSVIDDSGNKGSVTRKVVVGNKIKDNGIVNVGSVYLTFDDGPNDGTTNKILDVLKEEGVKATFFVTCGGSDNLIKRMYDEGHTVALHTASHEYSYIYSSIDNYFSDLNKVGNRVKKITGIDSKIIRFPGGSSNSVSKSYRKGIMTELTNLVLNEGYRYFDWNVDAMDASSARTSADVYYNVTSNLSINRANVVLMHDTKSITVGAIRDIIRYGKENNFQFKKIDMDTYMVRHGVNN